MAIPQKTPLISLMTVEAQHVAELNKILTMSVNRLDADIKALGKGATSPLTLMQAQATRAALTSFLGETFDSVEHLISAGVANAAQAASLVVSQYENQLLGLVMSPAAMHNLAVSEANRAAQGITTALQRVQGNSYIPLSKSVYNTQQLTLKWVDKRITQALVSGWSAQKLAGELASMINPAVKGGVSYAAMRTARTEINNAFHAASAERYNNSPIVMEVDWHLSSSHPEGDVCDSLAADSPYPKKSVPQKPHPQCYCYITPALPEPAKFLDNLLKGKYGQPPANPVKAMAAPAAKAGSKAAKATAQNAMHAAIKTDPKPSKENLGAQLGWTKEFSQKQINNLQAFKVMFDQLDENGKKYLQGGGGGVTKMATTVLPDEADNVAAWFNKQGANKYGAKLDDDPWAPSGTVGSYPPEAYDSLENYLDPPLIKVLEKNGMDPHHAENMIAQMDPDEFDQYLNILYAAKDGGAEGVENLLKTGKLDIKDNSFAGDLSAIAKGAEPKKVHTFESVAEEWDLPYNLKQDLAQKSGLTADQLDAQLTKLGKENVNILKSTQTPIDQVYFIKQATMPTHDMYDKPITPKTAPSFESIAKDIDIPVEWLQDSGATPQQLTLFFKGAKGTTGLEDVFKMQGEAAQKSYLGVAKNVNVKNIQDYDNWKLEHGFIDDLDEAFKPHTNYMELEDAWGVPTGAWEATGLGPDELDDILDWMQENPAGKPFWTKLNEAIEDTDEEAFVDNMKLAASVKKTPPKHVDPDTIPKPPAPSSPPPPMEMYDSYQDVAEIFIKGDFKPNLLKNTGATPQQIANYLEGMSQAEYDHFMALKWPSQKKHFEKLGTKKSIPNAEANITAGKASAAVPNPKPAATDDPVVLAKWRDKPKPNVPQDPPKPQTPGQQAFDRWVDDAQKKFAEFAAKTGNLKNDLTKSNNWSYFEKVIKQNDMSALKYLQTNKYVDQKLYDDAVAAMTKATTPDPGDAAKYKVAMDKYAGERAQYEQDLVDWRAANGITSAAKGVWDDVLVHNDNSAGDAWARSRFKNPTGESKDAIKTYSGSSYGSWNAALRANANRDTLPSGQWSAYTRKADAGMSPVPEDVIVRRGTNWDEFFVGGERKRTIPPPPPNDLIGTVQVNHGYISTSVGKTAAFGGQVQMRIRVPQGHGATYVDPFSSHKGERELLLSRSSEMYIHDVYQVDGQWWVDAEVVAKGEEASLWSPIPTPPDRRRR